VAKVIIKLVLSRFIYSIPMFIKILVTYSSCKHKHDVAINTSVQPNQKVKKAENEPTSPQILIPCVPPRSEQAYYPELIFLWP